MCLHRTEIGRYRRMYDLQVLGSKAERESMRQQALVAPHGSADEFGEGEDDDDDLKPLLAAGEADVEAVFCRRVLVV